MNAEDLLMIGAVGVAIYYFMHQSTAVAAASATPGPLAPAPSINVQPSTIPLSNPIASMTPIPMATPVTPAPTPGPAPVPQVPVMAIPPPPIGTVYTIPAPLAPVPYAVPAPPPPSPSSGPFSMTNIDPIPTPPGPVQQPATVQPGIVSTPAAPVGTMQVAPHPYIPPPPVTVYYPVMGYQFSRPGSTLYPGDTWTVTIEGAKPGATVSMALSQQGGSSATNQMGNVNSGGSFSYTGSVSTGTDGVWSEVWYVNGVQVGTFSFTVFDPVVNAVTPETTYNSNLANTPIGTPSAPRTGNLIIGGVVYGSPALNI